MNTASAETLLGDSKNGDRIFLGFIWMLSAALVPLWVFEEWPGLIVIGQYWLLGLALGPTIIAVAWLLGTIAVAAKGVFLLE